MPVGGSPSKRALRRARRLYRMQNGVWLALGFAAVLGAITFWTDPESVQKTAIGYSLQGITDDIWNACYMTGGLFIGVGIWRVSHRTEIVGHMFLASGMATNAAAVLAVAGFITNFYTLVAIVIASVLRAWFLWNAEIK